MKITLTNTFPRFTTVIVLLLVAFLMSCALGRRPVNDSRKIRILIVGGGSSHDFNKWYKQMDADLLRGFSLNTVTYTDRIDSIPVYLQTTDVLYLATNQDINSETRKAIFAFADAGHGIILGHPALWYNWPDWPEYNAQLVGGGARAHDKYDSFLETVSDTKHPLTAGLKEKAVLVDERYQYVHDPKGADIDVLVFSSPAKSDKIYPSVFVVKHPKARIIAIALGHDAGSHGTVFYRRLLINAVRWAAN